jgi:large subunit ribosomal protein L19
MNSIIIDGLDAAHKKKTVPDFEIGDTVAVGVRIVEGTKERIQPFIGVVIARRGGGMNETFTVRRIVANEGVERIFPLQSPRVVSIEVQRRGKVRRGKLYFLRDRVGKARRLRERRTGPSKQRTASPEAPNQNKGSASEPSAQQKKEVATTV